MNHRKYYISSLTHMYDCKKTGASRLDMASVTLYDEFSSFEAVRNHVLTDLRFPKLQADKFETYGWVPILYMPNERTFTNASTGKSFTRFGCWRNGQAEIDGLSVVYA